jgi:hypothetical protein
MPAKAMVAVVAFPCIDRFRGHGPLLQVAHSRAFRSKLPRAHRPGITFSVTAKNTESSNASRSCVSPGPVKW